MANEYSNARISYYNINTFPTVYFDGVLNHVGGSGSQSLYNTYVPYVNQRNAIPSDYTIDIAMENTGLDYTTTVTMENVGGGSGTNLILHFVVTESHMPISWGLAETVNSVNRLMVPNQNGTPANFTSGSIQTVELDFTISNYWDIENCEVIAFIQHSGSKEIKQGTKRFLQFPLYDIDVEAESLIHPMGLYCGSSIQPIVSIKNRGAENLQSCIIEYSINGDETSTYNWTGDLAYKYNEEVVLDEILFTPELINTFEFTVSNPNGEQDQNPDNNFLSEEFESAPQLASEVVILELKTDFYPSETTWEVTNSEGDLLYSGGPYGGASTVYYESWEFEFTDCYNFTIFDSQGDGICCSFGNGYYKLMDADSLIFAEGGQFSYQQSKPFEPYIENILMADFLADVTSIIEGEIVSFTDLSSGDITIWSWEFEGGNPATSTDQNPMVTYELEGVYDVSLTISDGSNATTLVKEDYIEVDHITGITTIDNSGVQVFPNPTTGKVYVEGVKDATVKVYNTAGTVVATFNTFNNQVIDLSDMNNGIYFIHITMDNGTISKKVNLIK